MVSPLPDAFSIAARLTSEYGLELDAAWTQEERGPALRITPSGVHPNEAFTIVTLIGWRRIETEFVPGPYAAELLNAMRLADEHAQSAFIAIAESILHDGAPLSVEVAGVEVNPLDPQTWPPSWARLRMRVSTGALVVEELTLSQLSTLLAKCAGRVLAMTLTLVPVEEAAVDRPGEMEGALSRSQTNRYERSRANRAACIAIHGVRCKACGFDFGEVYGRTGQGFIHVHHIESLASSAGIRKVINPAKDLVPLCPNCHAMVHTQAPPMTVPELQQLMTSVGARVEPALAREPRQEDRFPARTRGN